MRALELLVAQNPEHRDQILVVVLRDQEHSHRIAQEESDRLTRLNDAEIEIAKRNSHLSSVRVYGTFIMVFIALVATVWLGGEGRDVAAIGAGIIGSAPIISALIGNRKEGGAKGRSTG
jgi:hypothetical protein